jgi:hypothetical protein
MEQFMVDRAIVMNAESAKRRYAFGETLVAESEFRRARRRAFFRSFHRRHRKDSAGTSLMKTWNGVEFRFELDGLDGIVDEAGRLRRNVPPMPRALLREWCNGFLRTGDEEEDWIFTLRSQSGSWFLVGGGLALQRLEMLRMRGETKIRARLENPSEARSNLKTPDEACCEGARGAA